MWTFSISVADTQETKGVMPIIFNYLQLIIFTKCIVLCQLSFKKSVRNIVRPNRKEKQNHDHTGSLTNNTIKKTAKKNNSMIFYLSQEL